METVDEQYSLLPLLLLFRKSYHGTNEFRESFVVMVIYILLFFPDINYRTGISPLIVLLLRIYTYHRSLNYKNSIFCENH